MKVEKKGKSVSVVSINGALEVQLVDVDFGYTARLTVTTSAGFSPRLAPLLNEEMDRALQAMRKHMEACRLLKGKR